MRWSILRRKSPMPEGARVLGHYVGRGIREWARGVSVLEVRATTLLALVLLGVVAWLFVPA
jgi:hypothetical protein